MWNYFNHVCSRLDVYTLKDVQILIAAVVGFDAHGGFSHAVMDGNKNMFILILDDF